MRTLSLCVLLAALPAERVFPQSASDINTVMMRSTFKLAGNGSIGTAFVMGKPASDDPKVAYYVLVTAAHVLTPMNGEVATLFLRKKEGELYSKLPYPLKIREAGKPLWTTHPSADVAVMYVSLPKDADITLVSTELIATDDTLRPFEVHPGDRLACLGYLLNGESNDAGFAILRSGYIASYPLFPTKVVKSFLFDFNVFEGNSGGPVYLTDANRVYSGGAHMGSVQFLVGLVSEQKVAEEQIRSLSEVRSLRHQLGLGVVIHAALIREAIELLPPPTK